MANPNNFFKKGQSGNPNGRPKKRYSITNIMREIMSINVETSNGDVVEARKTLAIKILDAALKGDMTAAKLIWQYMDGLPPKNIETPSDDGINMPIPETDNQVNWMAKLISKVNEIQSNKYQSISEDE